MVRKKNKKVIKIAGRRRKIKGVGVDDRIMVVAVLVAIGIGLLIAFMPNAYKITIKGEVVGAVKDKKIIEAAKETVIAQLKSVYNADVKFEEDLQVKKYRAKKKDYIASDYLVSYMRKNMDILIAFKEIFVEGESIGIVTSDAEVEELKMELKKKYYGNAEVGEVDFGKKVEIKEVFAKESDLIAMDKLVLKCIATTPKTVEYEVKAGDTLSGIASSFGITVDSIRTANEGFTDVTVLKIGSILKANIYEPLLPLVIKEKAVDTEVDTEVGTEVGTEAEEKTETKGD